MYGTYYTFTGDFHTPRTFSMLHMAFLQSFIFKKVVIHFSIFLIGSIKNKNFKIPVSAISCNVIIE